MFKSGSIENELIRSMETTLVSNQLEKQHNFNKIAKAFDYLNAAADIFDKAGLQKESKEVEKVLQVLATQQMISDAFSTEDISEIFENLKDINAEDLKNIFEVSPFGMSVKITNMLYKILKRSGEEGPIEAIKNTLTELSETVTDKDQRKEKWNEIKSDVASKLATALKTINFAKFLG